MSAAFTFSSKPIEAHGLIEPAIAYYYDKEALRSDASCPPPAAPPPRFPMLFEGKIVENFRS